MAYSRDDLGLVASPPGGNYPRIFTYYNRAGDIDADIRAGGFFSDGVAKGMRVGDLVDAVNTGTAKYKRYQVTSLSGAAATVSTPAAIDT